MDAKEAIRETKRLVRELYADEDIAEIRLEELESEDLSDSWLVTLGLLRPARGPDDRHSFLRPEPLLKRTYKIVKIPNDHLAKKSMKIREMTMGD